MFKKIKRSKLMKKIVAGNLALQVFAAQSAYAALPWEDPLDTVVESLTGPVAQGVPPGLRRAGRGCQARHYDTLRYRHGAVCI